MDDLLIDFASEAWWDTAMEQWYAEVEDWSDPMEDDMLYSDWNFDPNPWE
jgi:hypothetical protein